MDWIDAGGEPPPELSAQIALDDLVARVLYARGYRDIASIQRHLNPDLIDDIAWPELPGIVDVLSVFARALLHRQGICVCGGRSLGDQVAIAVVISGLRQLGFSVSYSLQGNSQDANVDAFSTKPHQSPLQLILEQKDEASAVLELTDPQTKTVSKISAESSELIADHPFRFMSRAGLFWLVLKALAKAHGREGVERGVVDLCALSIIVDGAHMTGLNRSLVLGGISQLFFGPRLGLEVLIKRAKKTLPLQPTTDHVDHILAARLRAAEQENLAGQSVELLLAEDEERAWELSAILESGYQRERMAREKHAAELPTTPLRIEAYGSLSEIQPKIVHEIAQLGPFGRSNAEPILASRRVRLVNFTSPGLSRRHTRLLIEDEEGDRLPGVWWYKNPADVPRGWGDIAYNLRTDYYRGSENVVLQIVDFREWEVDNELNANKALPFTILDQRNAEDRLQELGKLREAGGELQIWAEAGGEVPGTMVRDQLQAGVTLVIWTAPPSPSILREVLERVVPGEVVVLTAEETAVGPGDFLRRLGGIAKWVLAHKDGELRVSELAGRLGELDATVLAGLELLAQKGLVGYREQEGRLQLLREANPGANDSRRLGQLLAESAAYRRYFARAPLAEIFQVQFDDGVESNFGN